MIEIARVILRWSLHILMWGSELIGAALLLGWLYYVAVLEPRIRSNKQTKPVQNSDNAGRTAASRQPNVRNGAGP